MREHRIIQWNAQGLRAKKDEVIKMIEDGKPVILAIQETMTGDCNKVRVPNFNTVSTVGHFNWRYYGGVALFIHESIPYGEVIVHSPLQIIAARVQLATEVTVCSVYLPPSADITLDQLNNALGQLPTPILLMGDFNAHHRMWGSDRNSLRGNTVEKFITDNTLNILNDGTLTRITLDSESVLDLSVCSPYLQLDIQWNVLSTPQDGDHNPIVLSFATLEGCECSYQTVNVKKADWGIFARHGVWKDLVTEKDWGVTDYLKGFPQERT